MFYLSCVVFSAPFWNLIVTLCMHEVITASWENINFQEKYQLLKKVIQQHKTKHRGKNLTA
jgi:hypothetical protein